MNNNLKPALSEARALRTALSALLLVGVMLVAGCVASPLYQAVAPSVTVSGISTDHVTLAEQTFTVALRVNNPNGFSLPVAGIDYNVLVDGKEIAKGATVDAFTLPAYGSQTVRVSLVGNFIKTLNLIEKWRETGSREVNYQLFGSIRLAGVPIRLPFSYADTFSWKLPY